MTGTSRRPSGTRLRRQRLRAHRLAGRGFASPAEVVRWMGAMQAQDYGQSLWAIASRLRHPSLAAVVDAVESGSILRTWPMRGTLHWVPAEDAAWMVSLSADRVAASMRRRHGELGITASLIDDAGELIAGELRGGERLVRSDVIDLWAKAGLEPGGQRGAHLLGLLAMRGLLAVGPMAGKQQTFVLLDEWAPAARTLDTDAGFGELAVRYANSHGPVTSHDFAWWAGIPVTRARSALESTGLTPTTTGQRTLWSGPAAAATASGVQLIAGFDEYVIGYTDRSDVLSEEDFESVVPGRNGVFFPCVLDDGQVVGTWKRTLGARLDVTVSPFAGRKVARADLESAAQRFAAAADRPLNAVVLD